jgi:phosphoserine phosphatase RsbU/P
MRKKTLKTNMILWIWSITALIFLLITGIDFIYTKAKMEKQIENDAVNLARYYGKRMDVIFSEASIIPKMMVAALETDYATAEARENKEETLKEYVKKTVELNPFIYGAGFAFEPYGFSSRIEAFAPYYCFEKGQITYYQLGEGDYNYFKWDWYSSTKEKLVPLWTEPYFDDVLMITYSYPFFRENKFMGLAEVDISLDQLAQDINKLKVMNTGYGFMLSQKGVFLAYPDKNKILKANISEVVPELAQKIKSLPELKSEGWVFLKTKEPLRGEDGWIILRPVRHAGTMVGSVGFVYPKKEVLADIFAMRKKTILVGSAGLTVLLFIIIVISDSIAKPITKLAEGVAKVAGGDLEHKISVTAKSVEVTKLQTSFNKMSDDLKVYIKNLKETTAANERIESELKIAREIQTGILPRIFPPFPQRKEFEIFATMEPAKEVGGDFYDFFLVNDNKLCFVIGDVSGKGVPAALFMMISKTLLKNAGLQDLPPEVILSRVNNIIALDNNASMFATVFCAILDIETGQIEFSNAGHNPPLICRNAGDFEFLETGKSFVLGPMQDYKFTSSQLKLDPGDIIFLYTDGVTEAMNPGKELFLERRLKEKLALLKGNSITDMIKVLRKEIAAFAQNEPQSDDITMLAVKYNGRG